MVNYYEELKLDREKNIDELNMELSRLEGVWKRREITNPEKAAKVLPLIMEARKVFSSESARAKYDKDLADSNRKTRPMSSNEQREGSLQKWVEQAQMHYDDGAYDLAKASIEKAFTYLDSNNEDPNIFALAADIYRECKDYDTAMNYINRAIILVPSDAYLYLLKASVCFEEINSYGKVYDVCVEEGKKTLNIALSKAEAANDNNMKATVLGVMAFSFNTLRPIDKRKAAELAWESKNVGVDIWGNAQKILDEIESERKAEQARLEREEEARKAAEKARRDREASERRAREEAQERARKEADERRRKDEAKQRVEARWRTKYVLAWVSFVVIGLFVMIITIAIVGSTGERLNAVGGFFALLVFFATVVFLNYTDAVYMGGTQISTVFSVSVGLCLTIQISGMCQSFGFFVFAMLVLIGCIAISRQVGYHTTPIDDVSRELNNGYSLRLPNSESQSEDWTCISCGTINGKNDYICENCGRHR